MRPRGLPLSGVVGAVRGARLPRTRSYYRRPDPNVTHPTSGGSLARLLTIARWGARIEWRALLHDSVHTTQGRIMIAISVFAVIPAWQILRNGENILMPFVSEGASPAFLIGGVYIGEIALLLGFALLLPIFLVKEFVVAERDSPLRSHPIAIPEEAVVRVTAVILWISAFLWTSFHLFFLPLLLYPGRDGRWVGVILHLLAGQLYFFPAGVAIAAVTRWAILAMGGSHWLRKYYPFGIIPFLTGYSLFLLLPKVLSDRSPEWVEALGTTVASRLSLPQPPVAVWISVMEGSWAGAMAWLLILLALTVWGGGVLWRWRRNAPIELIREAKVPTTKPKPLNFLSGSIRSRWAREFRLFWIKDIQALSRRNPLRAVRTHGILLSSSLTTLWVLARRLEAGEIAQPVADLILTALVVGIAGLLAMRSTLGKLGIEGSAVVLLRPVVSRPRLFGLKLAVAALETARLTAAYTLAITIIVPVLGAQQAPPFHLVLVGIGSGIVFVPLGIIIGFLLPDFRSRGLFLHGASTPSKLLYTSVISIAISCFFLTRWIQDPALTGGHGLAVGSALAAISLVVPTLSLLPLAVREPSWRKT